MCFPSLDRFIIYLYTLIVLVSCYHWSTRKSFLIPQFGSNSQNLFSPSRIIPAVYLVIILDQQIHLTHRFMFLIFLSLFHIYSTFVLCKGLLKHIDSGSFVYNCLDADFYDQRLCKLCLLLKRCS